MADEQIRVDLAAAYRLADQFGLNEGIFNHLTVLLPERGRILSQPIGMHWSEVTASSLLEFDFEGDVVAGTGQVERSTVCIHAPIHRAFETARCVFHTHMPFASTLTRLADPRIRPTGQTEIRFWNRIAYDEAYNGLVYDMAEGERLASILGPRNQVLMLSNHGVLVVGRTVAETFDRLYYLERAAQAQVYAMWTGQPLKEIAPDVIERTRRQSRESPLYYGRLSHELHFEALKRVLDKRNPGYES